MNAISVETLRGINFSSLPLERKLEIKNLGRPIPEINITKSTKNKEREIKRMFNLGIYNKNEWICGCENTNKLFCFPCLLFKSEETAWIKTGVDDLGHLSQKIKKHERSKSHMTAQLEFNLLGKHNIRQQLDSVFRQSVERENNQIRKNRYVLSKIIDCVKFCGAFELALRGHDETMESSNPGIFRGLINFSAEIDIALKEHFSKATVFKGTSKEIQNDLLTCMLDVYHERIREEIKYADFVSIIADESTDISTVSQLVLVLRYILPCGKPVERFWGFISPPEHDAKSLAGCLKETLSSVVECPDKVISQSYDGANVMSGRHAGVQAILKQHFQYAHYIHCYAHVLNLILAQATSQNTDVRIFFADLNEIPNFFSNSSQRTAVLNNIVGRKIPRASNTRWNFKSKTVQVVYENRDSLVECMEEIENSSRQGLTITQARGLRLKLEHPTFQFWLTLFYQIMPHVDILYNQLQRRCTDPITVKNSIANFEKAVQKVRDIVTVT